MTYFVVHVSRLDFVKDSLLLYDLNFLKYINLLANSEIGSKLKIVINKSHIVEVINRKSKPCSCVNNGFCGTHPLTLATCKRQILKFDGSHTCVLSSYIDSFMHSKAVIYNAIEMGQI